MTKFLQRLFCVFFHHDWIQSTRAARMVCRTCGKVLDLRYHWKRTP